MEIFIKGSVPSSKNSKIWTGRFLVWSKPAQKYVKETELEWAINAKVFKSMIKDYPIKCLLTFIRGSKHKFDYVNPAQTIFDMMVKYGWIEDDNADVIIPYFEPYLYDKENPGVIIKVL
jgi:hypothetical protein